MNMISRIRHLYRTPNDPLLLVRAVACIVIIWAHIGPAKGWLFAGSTDVTYLTFPNPLVSVFLFYMISAYGIGSGFRTGRYTLAPMSLLAYYRNRILRIVPLYGVCLLLSYFFFYRSYGVQPSALLPFLTFTANDITKLPFHGPLAIISTEMRFYLVAPFLFMFLKSVMKRIPQMVSVMLIFLFGTLIRLLLVWFGAGNDPFTYSAMIYTSVAGNIDVFLFGFLISIMAPSLKISRKHLPVLTAAFAVLLAGFYVYAASEFYFWGAPDWFRIVRYQRIFVFPVCSSLLLGMFILLVTGFRSLGGIRFWAVPRILRDIGYHLGLLSYGLYVWHIPIFDYLFRTNDPGPKQSVIRFMTVFVLSYLLSAVTYIIVERPFLRLKIQGRNTTGS